jgi:hypothetical protein
MFLLSYAPATYPPNLSVGGAFTLEWQGYLNPVFRLGLEGGGTFSFSPNFNILWTVPLTAEITYSTIVYPFEISASLGAGINMVKYQDEFTIDPLVRPGIGVHWIFSSDWSFGLNVDYWWDMMFSATPAESRVGNFLDISLSARYHYHL